MPFLVFEPDPIVRADICETLMAEFADQIVIVAETAQSFQGLVAGLADPVVAVLSMSKEEGMAAVAELSAMTRDTRIVLIGDGLATDAAPAMASAYLQKPFTTKILVDAIKTAFSAPQKDPS